MFSYCKHLKVRGCHVFTSGLVIRGEKGGERVLKHTPVCLFGHIIGN